MPGEAPYRKDTTMSAKIDRPIIPEGKMQAPEPPAPMENSLSGFQNEPFQQSVETTPKLPRKTGHTKSPKEVPMPSEALPSEVSSHQLPRRDIRSAGRASPQPLWRRLRFVQPMRTLYFDRVQPAAKRLLNWTKAHRLATVLLASAILLPLLTLLLLARTPTIFGGRFGFANSLFPFMNRQYYHNQRAVGVHEKHFPPVHTAGNVPHSHSKEIPRADLGTEHKGNIDTLSHMAGNLKDSISSGISDVKDRIADAKDEMKQSAGKVWETVKDSVTPASAKQEPPRPPSFGQRLRGLFTRFWTPSSQNAAKTGHTADAKKEPATFGERLRNFFLVRWFFAFLSAPFKALNPLNWVRWSWTFFKGLSLVNFLALLALGAIPAYMFWNNRRIGVGRLVAERPQVVPVRPVAIAVPQPGYIAEEKMVDRRPGYIAGEQNIGGV